MSARSFAASCAQKRAIAKPFQAEMPTSPPKRLRGLANPRHQRLVARHDQRGADGDAALRDRRAGELFADVAVEPHGFREHQPAAAAQPPAVDKTPGQHFLAHRGAAEHHDFAQQQRGALGKIDVDAPVHPRPVEQDGFLRQPGEMRARRGLQGDVELRRRSLRAIDFFGGGGRHREARALAGRDVDVKTVAAGDAARGVDEHRGKPLRFRRRKPHPQRAGFVQLPAARDAVDQSHVEFHRADRAVGREDFRGGRHSFPPAPLSSFRGAPLRREPGIQPQPMFLDSGSARKRASRNDGVYSYSAMARLISPGSRLLRSQLYLTAPRSITAKWSPSSQAKSRYCSTSTMAMLPRLRR